MAAERGSNNMNVNTASNRGPAKRMNQELFKRLVRESWESTPQNDRDAYSAIEDYILARSKHDIDMAFAKVKALIARGPRKSILNRLSATGTPPLLLALRFRRTDAIAFLIRQGVDVNIPFFELRRDDNYKPIRDASGRFIVKAPYIYTTPLIYAATLLRLDKEPLGLSEEERAIGFRENNEPLRLLLNAPGIKVNVKDHEGKTALHHAAAFIHRDRRYRHELGFPSRVRMLLEHGADPTIRDNRGRIAINDAEDPEVRQILQDAMERWGQSQSASASASASANRGGKRKTHRRTHHRRRTHRK